MARSSRIAVRFLILAATAVPGSAGFAQAPDSQPQEPPPEVAALFEAAAAELMKPGDKREDWNRGGTDLYGLVAASPGGAQGNYLLSIDKDGARSLTIVGGAGPALPPRWQVVSRTGSAPPAGAPSDATVGGLMPPYFFSGVQGRRRVGDAFCSSGAMSGVLYRDSAAQDSTVPQPMVQLMFEQIVKQFQTATICWRYDREGDSYRTTYYLEDGRALPGMNAAAEQLRIVPADSLEKLLEPAAIPAKPE